MEQDIIPYGKHEVREEDINEVVNVLRNEYLAQGSKVPEFEGNICKLVKCNHALCFNSATSALHAACLALEIGKDDIVWTTPISFVASANCALYCGASIEFVDIDSETFNISINELEQKLATSSLLNKLPKAIIIVHLAGCPCDTKTIHRLCKSYNISIIEDASHALGSINDSENYVGSCKYSDISIFSLHPVKMITSGEGGVATTNDPKLAHSLAMIRSHGITKDEKSFTYTSPGIWYYEQKSLGFNFRMSDINAALANSQLRRITSIVKKRNELLDYYRQSLQETPISFQKLLPGSTSSYHLAIIRINSISFDQYKMIFNEMHRQKILVQLHYLPIHLQPYYRNLGFKEGDFPNAENYSKSCFSLPLFTTLTLKNIDYISHALNNALKIYV